MISGLGHQSFKPGSLVRDRDDNKEYVIESFSILTGGAIVASAVALNGGEIRRFFSPSVDTFSEEFMHVRMNSANLSADEVRDKLHQISQGFTNSSREFKEKLEHPSNQVFRDLLRLAADNDQDYIDKGIINLAQQMFNTLGNTPSLVSVNESLKKLAAGSEYTDEFVAELSKSIIRSFKTVARQKNNGRLVADLSTAASNELAPLFFGVGRPNSPATIDGFLRFLKSDNRRKESVQLDMVKRLLSPFYDKYNPEGLTSRDIPFLSQLGINDYGLTPKQRLVQFIADSHGLSEADAKKIANRHFSETTQAIEKGEVTPFMRLLWEGMSTEQKALVRVQHDNDVTDVTKLNTVKTQQRNRTSAMGRHQKKSNLLRSKIDFKKINKYGNDHIRVFNKQAFMEEVIGGGTKVRLDNGEVLTLKELLQKTDLRKIFKGHQHEFVSLSKEDVAEIIRQKERGGIINLNSILATSNKINQMFDAGTVATLDSKIAPRHLGTTEATTGMPMLMVQMKPAVSGDIQQKVRTDSLDSIIQLVHTPSTGENTFIHARIALDGEEKVFYGNSMGKIMDQLGQYAHTEDVVTLKYGKTTQVINHMSTDADIAAVLSSKEANFDVLQFKMGDRPMVEAQIREQLMGQVTTRNNRARAKVLTKTGFYSTEAAFETSLRSTQSAIKNFKARGSSGRVARMLVTDMGGDIETQIELSKKFMSKPQKAYILDTEVEYRGATPIIHDLSMRRVKDGKEIINRDLKAIAKSEGRQMTHVDRAKMIIDLAQKVKEISAEGGIIATQTGADFRWLIQTTYDLEDQLPGMVHEITKARGILQKANSQNKIFDLTVAHQIAGTPSGSVSQQKIALEYGIVNKDQTHTADPDVLQAIETINHPDYQRNFKEGIGSMKNGHGGNYFMDSEGNILTHRATVHSHTGHGFSNVFDTHEFVKNKEGIVTLQATGLQLEHNMAGVHALGAGMHTHLLDGMSPGEIQLKQAELLAHNEQRTLRAIFSPESRYMYDTFGQTTMSGSSMLHLTFGHTRDLFKKTDIRSAYQLVLNGQFGTIAPTMQGREIAATVVAAKYVKEHLGNMTMQEDVRAETELRVVELVKHALMGTKQSEAYMGDTMLSRYIDSAAGQHMFGKAQMAAMTGETAVFDAPMLLIKALALKQEHFATDMSTYKPRFNLGLGDQAISHDLLTSAGIADIGRTTRNLAAEVLLASRKERDNEGSRKVLDLMFGKEKADRLAEAAQKFADLQQLNLNSGNKDFKQAATALILQSTDFGDRDYAELRKAVDELANSEHMEGAIHKLFNGKMGERSSVPIEAQKFGQGIIERAMAEKNKHFGNLATSLQAVMDHEYNSSDENRELMYQFFGRENQSIFDIGGFTKHIMSKSAKELTEFEQQIQDALSRHNSENKLSEQTIFHLLQEAVHGYGDMSDPKNIDKLREDLANGSMVKRLAFEGNAHRAGTTTQPMTEAAMRLGNLAPHSGSTGFLRDLQHMSALKGTLPGFEGAFERMAAPLALVGGVAALMSAFGPNADHFSQGVQSDNYNLGTISRNSEIVGSDWSVKTYHGEESPFKINITFSGYLKDKCEHKKLMKTVFNGLSDHIETVSVNNDFRDDTERINDYHASTVMRGL